MVRGPQVRGNFRPRRSRPLVARPSETDVTTPALHPDAPLPWRMFRGASRLLGATLRFLVRAVPVGWATLALYYSDLPGAPLRAALAVAFLAFGVWALWITHRPRMPWLFAGLFVLVAAYWATILPSHDRPWRREVAAMPQAIIDGDRVRLLNVRNFEYRNRDDFTVRYEERDVQLSHLVAVDFYVSYWRIGPVSHTFVSFIFDNAPPVSISIETRPEVGEGFDPVASLFKQFELIYVIGDERDLVRLRTDHRDEDVFLYRTNASPAAARELFLVYLERINQLHDHPEFYHLLSNSCTINIIRYANIAGRRGGFDVRHYLNGFIDAYLYNSGRIDTSLPFDELRRRSRINEVAHVAGMTDTLFARIRAGLPSIGAPRLASRAPP